MSILSTVKPSVTPHRAGEVHTTFTVRRHLTLGTWELDIEQWLDHDIVDGLPLNHTLLTKQSLMLSRQEFQALRAACVL